VKKKVEGLMDKVVEGRMKVYSLGDSEAFK
jgi:hypothetical protein